SPRRRHIHTVAYSAPGRLFQEDLGDGRTSVQIRGLAYFVQNPNNGYYNDPRGRAFRNAVNGFRFSRPAAPRGYQFTVVISQTSSESTTELAMGTQYIRAAASTSTA